MFKVWDKVRIKSREQMEKEFGLDEYWDINCKYYFWKDMKLRCWETAEISDIDWTDIKLINRSYNEEVMWFTYTIDMIELVEPERTPTPWEYVEISDDYTDWYERIYLCTNNNSNHYYVDLAYVSIYNSWKSFMATSCRYIRQLKKQTYIIEATEEQYKKIQGILEN